MDAQDEAGLCVELDKLCDYCIIFISFSLFLHQDGSTPLILAAQMSRAELCAFLLGRGANADMQDSEGR